MKLIYKFKDIFAIIGGLLVGWSIPINSVNLLPTPDYYVFAPIGVILLILSFLSIQYHYKK